MRTIVNIHQAEAWNGYEGPMRFNLDGAGPAAVDQTHRAVATRLREVADDGAVRLRSNLWLVRAVRPAARP